FYELVGFTPVTEQAPCTNATINGALGLAAGRRAEGILLGTAEGTTVLDLIEWDGPAQEPPPATDRAARIGVHRIAVVVDDLDAVLARLADAGVAPLSDPVRSRILGGVRFVCVPDPDGTLVELFQFDDGRTTVTGP
ncbi:MAG: VOC family protein, partial [Acidimicrobiia bacterium]